MTASGSKNPLAHDGYSRLRLLGLTEEEFAENETAQALTTRLGAELGVIPAGIYGDGVVNILRVIRKPDYGLTLVKSPIQLWG